MCAGVHDRSVRRLLAWLFTLSAWEYRLLPTAAFAIRARPSLSISVSPQRLLADLGKCRVAYPHRLEDTACIGRCTAPTVLYRSAAAGDSAVLGPCVTRTNPAIDHRHTADESAATAQWRREWWAEDGSRSSRLQGPSGDSAGQHFRRSEGYRTGNHHEPSLGVGTVALIARD